MLEKMRENSKGLLSWAIVILIGLTFVMWGVNDYFSGTFGRKYAAKVNGEKLTWKDVEMNYERARRQKTATGLSEKDLKEQVRLMLIQRTALLGSVRGLGLKVGEQQLADALVQIPIFQEEGKFSKAQYLDVLASNGFTDASFRKELEQDLILGQLEQGLTQTNFSLPSEVERVVELFDERRNFGYFMLTQQKFRAGIELSNEDLKNYYEKNKSNFVIPERVSLEYVELSLDQIAKQQKVSDEEIQAFYKEHIASYTAPERVRARHILIAAPAGEKGKGVSSASQESGKDKEKEKANQDKASANKNSAASAKEMEAQAKANDLLARINKGEDFAALAKEHSDDKGSAKNGGDLGWFTKGQMVPVFDKAVFALKEPKEVAGPIRSPFGFHIIQLLEHKPAETRPLAEVQELVREQLQREKALAIYTEKSEALSKLAFEKNSSLTPIAEELGLSLQTTGFFGRSPLSRVEKSDDKQTQQAAANEETNNKITENPFVVATAFTDAVLKQKNNSEPLQIDEYDLIVLRIKDHVPAVQQSYDEASNQVKERLLNERTKEKVKELAESIQKRIREGENPASLASNLSLSWNVKTDMTRHHKVSENANANNPLTKDILSAVFQLPHSDKGSSTKALALANGDYAILVLEKVTPGNMKDVEPAMQKAYQRSVKDGIAQLEFALYANQVMNDARVEISE